MGVYYALSLQKPPQKSIKKPREISKGFYKFIFIFSILTLYNFYAILKRQYAIQFIECISMKE